MARKQREDDAPGGEIFFSDYTDDVVKMDGREVKPSDNCFSEKGSLKNRAVSVASYLVAVVLSFLYTMFIMRPETVNKDLLRQYKDTGYFLYGNHTHPEGDVFGPIRAVFPKRVSALISAENLKVPFLGKLLLPYGCLVVPDSPDEVRQFTKGIEERIKAKRAVLVYPEAHVWPWCTFIRPFSEASFHYPVDLDAPSFCMTTTYQRPRHGKRPRTVVYIDGPFMPQKDKNKREARKLLHDDIYSCMQDRSRSSDYEYVRYVRKAKE